MAPQGSMASEGKMKGVLDQEACEEKTICGTEDCAMISLMLWILLLQGGPQW